MALSTPADYQNLLNNPLNVQTVNGFDENGNPISYLTTTIDGQTFQLIPNGDGETYTVSAPNADVTGAFTDGVSTYVKPTFQVALNGGGQYIPTSYDFAQGQRAGSWLDESPAAIPILAALAFSGGSLLSGTGAVSAGGAGGAGGTGAAGWTSGYDLAGGGSLGGTDVATMYGSGGGAFGGGAGGGAAGGSGYGELSGLESTMNSLGSTPATAANAGAGAGAYGSIATSGAGAGTGLSSLLNGVNSAGKLLPLAGALAGASQPSTLNSTSTSQLPAWLQPYAEDYARRAQGVSQTGFTPDQQQAFGLLRQQAGQTSPLNTAAQQSLLDTMSGKYLDPATNPYLKGTFDSAAGRMQDVFANNTAGMNAAFSDAGGFGSSAHQTQAFQGQRAFGDSLANLANSIYGTNYQNERTRQAQATNFAPSAAGQMQDYSLAGTNALLTAGNQQQDLPYKNLQAYGSIFGKNFGNSTTQQTPGVSRTSGLLGGFAGGLGLYGAGKQAGIWS